jgi:hypothetical protein
MVAENDQRRLDEDWLYGLGKREQVLFSIFPDTAPTITKSGMVTFVKRISRKKMETDQDFKKLHREALNKARKIENGPAITSFGPIDMEMQGHFKDIRVEVARNTLTGHRVKGFTLIGVPR